MFKLYGIGLWFKVDYSEFLTEKKAPTQGTFGVYKPIKQYKYFYEFVKYNDLFRKFYPNLLYKSANASHFAASSWAISSWAWV